MLCFLGGAPMSKAVMNANENKLTPTEIKKINRKRTYDFIYQSRLTSKLAISEALNLSLPTVTQNLDSFIKLGLVEKKGEYESTGGRRAQVIRLNEKARIAIGVMVLKECTQIAAVDLYGDIIQEDTLSIHFKDSEDYYEKLGSWINTFAKSLPYPTEHLLGVSIALQGLVSPDGEIITYAEILQCTGAKRATYQKYIDLPCYLIHDTEAAATAALWQDNSIENAVYLLLNRNFGGILIVDGQVVKGRELGSGIIEHMCLHPDGPTCYCGKQGCVETYCSAGSLKNMVNMELPEFFRRVHDGDPRCSKIWRSYLKYLAIAVDNIRMVVDCDFILGGYLLQFMNSTDVELLTNYVKEQCAFDTPSFKFLISKYGEKSTQLGAAITLVKKFLESI